MPPSSGRGRPFALLLAAGAVAWLSAAFLIGSPPDEEEFRFALLAARLRVHALAAGDLTFWTSLLGFGIPQPFVPNFALHPLAPLLAWLSPVAWMRLLLLAHTIVGAAGMWQMGRALELGAVPRAVAVVTFLLATPTQNYVLSDFWPSHFIMWTAMPWVLVLTWRMLDQQRHHDRRRAILLGLVMGLAVASTNPGYVAIYGVLAVIVVAARWRAVGTWWTDVLIAAAITTAIAAPNVIQLASERRLFSPELAFSNLPDPLPADAWWDVFFRPFSSQFEGTRTVFMGGPLTILAAWGCVRFATARPDLVLVVAVTLVMLFADVLPVPFASARYHARDPLMLAAIPLGTLVLDRWLGSPRQRLAAYGVVALQCVVMFGAAWPFIARTLDPAGRAAVTARGATGATPLVDDLTSRMAAPGRLLYSPRVDHEVSERALVDDGLGVNALAYRGVPVVNGSFKGVSTDTIWPDDRLFYGRIRTPQWLITSNAALDILGVRYVLAHRDEPVAAGLRPVASARATRGRELVLFENTDAWPLAFLVNTALGDDDVEPLAACGNTRLLCRDVSAIVSHRDPRSVKVERNGAAIYVALDRSASPAVLVVSEMFRRDWIATSGRRRLETRPMYGGLLGVPLPSGATDVHLLYRPMPLLIATAVSYAVVLVGFAVALVPSSRFWGAFPRGRPSH